MLHCDKPRKSFWIAIAIVFCFRAWVALDTSFWCDELNWVRWSAETFWQTFQRLRYEGGPHGPLDLLLIRLCAQLSLPILPPHIALRILPNLFCTATAALALLAPKLSGVERKSWILWAVFAEAINAQSTNARPYAGMIFFSSCLLFLFIDLFRNEAGSKISSFSVGMIICTLLGSFGQVYTILPLGAMFALLPLVRIKVRQKIAIAFFLVLSLALRILWFKVWRVPLELKPVEDLGHSFISYSWWHVSKVTVQSILGAGTPLLVAIPEILLCAFCLFRARTQIVLYLCLAGLFGLVVPTFLNIRYQYFFAGRQMFTLLPLWGWCLTMASVELEQRARGITLRKFVPIGFFIVLLAPAYVNWLKNTAPYSDTPRYHVHHFVSEAYSRHTLLVLSVCQREGAEFYADPAQFKNYFEQYGNAPEQPKSKNILLWSSSWSSCFGVIPSEPDNVAAEQAVTKNRDNLVIYAPSGMLVPSRLKGITCHTEVDGACSFAEDDKKKL